MQGYRRHPRRQIQALDEPTVDEFDDAYLRHCTRAIPCNEAPDRELARMATRLGIRQRERTESVCEHMRYMRSERDRHNHDRRAALYGNVRATLQMCEILLRHLDQKSSYTTVFGKRIPVSATLVQRIFRHQVNLTNLITQLSAGDLSDAEYAQIERDVYILWNVSLRQLATDAAPQAIAAATEEMRQRGLTP
jgi:hypothetical protein